MGDTGRPEKQTELLRNIDRAKTQKTRISVVSSVDVSECHRVYTVTSAQVQDHSVEYEVNICTKPSCSCPEGLKLKRTVCKHVLWVYMFVLGLTDSSPLLQQVHLKTEEVKKMLKKSPESSEVQLPFVGDQHIITEDLQSSSAGQPKYLPASKARNSNPFILKYLEPNVKVCASCPHPDNTFEAAAISH